jgi:hypothetical protein
MPTTAHFIYIPVVLVLGIVIGFVLGGRAARDAFAAQKEREDARAARRAARNGANGKPSSNGVTTNHHRGEH